MTRRAQKRQRPRGRTAAVGKTQPGTRPVVDSTLRSLLINYLALADGNTLLMPDGRVYLSADALLYVRACMEREAKLPPGSLQATLASLLPARGHA